MTSIKTDVEGKFNSASAARTSKTMIDDIIMRIAKPIATVFMKTAKILKLQPPL
jgi:hypothetical protein